MTCILGLASLECKSKDASGKSEDASGKKYAILRYPSDNTCRYIHQPSNRSLEAKAGSVP